MCDGLANEQPGCKPQERGIEQRLGILGPLLGFNQPTMGIEHSLGSNL